MNAGVRMIMDRGVLLTRLGNLLRRRANDDLRGMSGALNLEFTGEDGGTWNLAFEAGRMRMGRGAAAEARATVRVSPQDYLALLAGDLGMSVARMTGRVRVRGDGNLALVFGASVGALRALQSAPGLRGWIGRRLVRRALRRGGYRSAAAVEETA